MRFHTLLLILTFAGIMSVSVLNYWTFAKTTGQKSEQLRHSYSAKRFIAESFRNTCGGRGFDSLEEWQLTCRQLFNLEYIAWCPADEFMIDEESSVLMYGKWIGKDNDKKISGEVYCRMNP